jgi:hypothetical protein
MYNKTVNGQKLTKKQREEIYNASARLMDWATRIYNNTLDDYAAMINYWWNASNLGKKWTYITDEYINMYWNPTSESTNYPTSTNTLNTAWVYQFPSTWWLNLGLTNVWWYNTYSNFY